MPPNFKDRFFQRITGVSLRTKIVGMVLSAVLLIGLATTITVRARLDGNLERGLEERGIAIGRYVAARATDLVLTDNTFALYQLLRVTLENNLDVRYVYIVDSQNQVIAHTFLQNVPRGLMVLNQLGLQDNYRLQPFKSEEGQMIDIAVPMLDGQVGVAHIGLSLNRLHNEVAQATQQLLVILAISLFLGAGIALVLTRVLTRPILDLVAVTRQLEAGDLEARARFYMADEVGELAQAFNAMADSLQASHISMLRRVRELAILNATATAISSTLNRQAMLQAALSKVLEELGLQAGWVFLEDLNSPTGLHLAAQQGLSKIFAYQEATRELGDCVCARVMQTGEALIVHDICTECQRIDSEVVKAEKLTSHASIPLVSRNQVIGVLNVASRDARLFSENDLSMLDSIGRQIGVAAENARLWEEVKEKETLRGQLLEKIITAQENERQRLARELHDEAGQALTSLKFSLRNLERVKNPASARSQLQSLRDFVGQIQKDLHDLALELHPPALDELGLVAALQNFATRYARHTELLVEFQTLGMGAEENYNDLDISPQIAVAAYRLVQEALTNVARHARAQKISILLEHKDNQIFIIVDDDGDGFDVHTVFDQHSVNEHLGIHSMKERVEMLGGVFTVESRLGEGSTVFARLPLVTFSSKEGDMEAV